MSAPMIDLAVRNCGSNAIVPGKSCEKKARRHMQLGMIGLGRMGGNMVRRLMKAGHTCVVYDRDPKNTEKLVAEGATGAKTLEDFCAKLTPPRAAWVMVPAG